nr:unnamed protein product [Callosobruchus chinensis]CAH7741289.1 unnamed protein product [Callosobruchus chinensis]CAH7742954.1 unnamed protein product [Callosobruchus chinensis]
MAADTDVSLSQGEKNCEICGDSIRKSCVKCEGDNCNVVLHSKCFETIAKIFFAERKNWKCKNCACKHKSGTLSTSGDIAILRHEIECLNREKQLLNELNDELKSNNNLLKEKLSHTQISYAAKTKMSLPEETARPTTSYSESVKKNRTSAGVIIKTNCSSTTCDDIIADLQKNIKPAELKLCLNGVKKIKNGIIIHCEDKKSQETLEENAKTKLGSKYTVNQTRLWNPRLLIKNVHYKQGTTDDEIMDDLQSLNHIESNEMKLVTKLNYGNTTNLVLEVTPALRNKLTYQGYIYAGWGRCSVTDHLRLVKCYKCSGLGHSEKICKSTIICPACTGSHHLKDCTSHTLKCINCERSNDKYKTKLNTNHSSIDTSKCSVLQNYINRLKSNIAYEESKN